MYQKEKEEISIVTSIEKVAEQLIRYACTYRVSDVHVIPREEDAVVQVRMGKELMVKEVMSKQKCERLIAHFKFLGGMDIGEKRKPQSGSLAVTIDDAPVSLRFSTLPTVFDESLVIRVLLQNHVTPLHQLSLFPSTTRKLISLLKHSHGLIIFTGPTGSGKTTTLYTLLNESKKLFNRNIITLEDPIERRSEGVLQVQVNEKAGITYSTGLRAILRHDPDIIMVGEIRDDETAQIAVRAALTGHLVLTTMHTRDAPGAIYRLLEFGVRFQEIEQTLVAVAAQRLVDLQCPFCPDVCHPLCRKMRRNRQASVYELLYGKALNQVMKEVKGERVSYCYVTLRDTIKKGIALGYLYPQSLDGWGSDE
jgi:competence protein ComGA